MRAVNQEEPKKQQYTPGLTVPKMFNFASDNTRRKIRLEKVKF